MTRRLCGAVLIAMWAVLAACSGEPRPATRQGTTSAPAASAADAGPKVRIVKAAPMPELFSLPYADALTEWLVEPLEPRGTLPARFVVRVWGMRGHKATEAAAHRAGDSIALEMVPLDQAPEEVRQAARFSLPDPPLELIDLPVWWGQLR